MRRESLLIQTQGVSIRQQFLALRRLYFERHGVHPDQLAIRKDVADLLWRDLESAVAMLTTGDWQGAELDRGTFARPFWFHGAYVLIEPDLIPAMEVRGNDAG